MPGTVYALLVGINDYSGSLRSLSGCVADIRGYERILVNRVADDERNVKVLTDGEATRGAVLDAFALHLGRAGAGDVALFAFSGHGSTEAVEQRFWFFEPTGRNQTIVLADSREPGMGDLADKELNELLRVPADAGAHVVVILDCCHAGGGTRDDGEALGVVVRRAPPADGERSVESYAPALREAVSHGHQQARPHPRHIALSACESTQLSRELPVDGMQRGVFSAELQRALSASSGAMTYRDLIRAAANGVRNRVGDQSPTAFAEGEELDQPFLGGGGRLRPSTMTVEHEAGRWFLDAGTVHGIAVPTGAETTVLSLLASDASPDDPPLGRVTVVETRTARSVVEPEPGLALSPGARYPARVVSVPLPPTSVELRGAAAATARIRAAFAGSPHVREVVPGSAATGHRVAVAADETSTTIQRPDGTPVTNPLPANEAGARQTAARLEHLARWQVLMDLDNPTSPLAGTVSLTLVPATKGASPPTLGTQLALIPGPSGVITLDYQRSGDEWLAPYVFMYLHNGSNRDLYCTLLDLTDRFRSHTRLFEVERIRSGGTAVALGGRAIDISIPRERLAAGGSEVRDWLKVIAAEHRFETDALDLPPLDGVAQRSGAARRGRTSLDRLMWHGTFRDAGDDAVTAADEVLADWTTTTVPVLTRRPVGP